MRKLIKLNKNKENLAISIYRTINEIKWNCFYQISA